jgi:pectin methylesterase-like acyl-CoA thioesterase
MGVLQKSRITTTTIALAALMLFTAGRAMATTRVVFQGDESCIDEDDPEYSTITAAVDASNDGDTIEVCDGTYTEAFTIFQNDLTLESVNSLGATIQAPYHLTPAGAIIEVIGNEDFVAPFAGSDGGASSSTASSSADRRGHRAPANCRTASSSTKTRWRRSATTRS